MEMKRFVIVLIAVMFLTSGITPVFAEDVGQKTDQEILMNFKDAPIIDVLEYLSKTVGLVIVSDVFIEGRITVISQKPIGVDRAISLINSIVKVKGFAVVRMGQTLKVVELAAAKQMSIPVKTGNDPKEIIPGDDLVTHIVPVRYIDATKLREGLLPLVPEYAELSTNEGSNSLIITDTTANIKRLLEIINALDTQMAAISEVRVFRLVYADAENTADLINEVFDMDKRQSSSSNDSRNPFSRMASFMGGRGGGGGDRGRGGSDRGSSNQSSSSGGPDVSVVAAADERTSTVVVSGPSDILDVVEKVITELDSNPDEERTIFIYFLKNARSDNLKEVLNNLFQEMEEINEDNAGSSRGGGSSQGRRQSSTNNSSGTSDLSDEVYFEADEDTNALLIMTSSKNYDKIKAIIDDLDKPVPQVLIKVLLAEVTVNNGLDLGVEFSVLNMRDSGGQSLFGTEFLPDDISAGFVTKVLEGDLGVTLHALENVGKLNVLSRPYILTSNNQTARITVGEEVPFIRDTRTTETGQTINTIEYEDIGIILEVTPYINPQGLVIMDILPEISTTTAETVPISETVNAAVFAKRSSQSRVAVKNGQTIVIGGLMEDQETESVEKVPLLGDLPVLGGLFKKTVKAQQKTELLMFLTPQVASKESDLQEISGNERKNSNILQNLDQNKNLRLHIENLESFHQPVKTNVDVPIRTSVKSMMSSPQKTMVVPKETIVVPPQKLLRALPKKSANLPEIKIEKVVMTTIEMQLLKMSKQTMKSE
ncbi:MAG: type II secretion system secretin GspD [Phycisphaerae bacterium]|nr:type II secretion system secretin GspD [Phycisphaerae bacterium]